MDYKIQYKFSVLHWTLYDRKSSSILNPSPEIPPCIEPIAMDLIPLPVIPIQIQLPVGRRLFNSNSNSWIERRPILNFWVLHKPVRCSTHVLSRTHSFQTHPHTWIITAGML